MKRTYSLIALILIVSLFIYLFYRTEKTVVNELLMLLVSLDTFAEIRSSITKTIPLNELIIFSLPGGLWVFCTTVLSKDLYMKIENHKIQLMAVPILFAIGLEFCQLIHITQGTFDLWDIGFYLMFWLLGYWGFQPRNPQQNIMSSFTLNGYICLACFLSVYLAHVSQ
jgi:hypothetical protein